MYTQAVAKVEKAISDTMRARRARGLSLETSAAATAYAVAAVLALELDSHQKSN